jgi:hypothetical protein
MVDDFKRILSISDKQFSKISQTMVDEVKCTLVTSDK